MNTSASGYALVGNTFYASAAVKTYCDRQLLGTTTADASGLLRSPLSRQT
jgi:hypothetical protein